MKALTLELLRRLPLAHVVLMCWSFIMDKTFLDNLFEKHRGPCYERELRFSTFVQLIRDALVAKEDGARRTFERARESGELPVSETATYGKLSRVPVKLSNAFLRYGAMQLSKLMPKDLWTPPRSLADFDLLCGDGKVVKHVQHRLKATRPFRGKLLGAKLLVVQNIRSGLAILMNASEEAERNEVRLMDGVMEQIENDKPILWVEDRQYSDLKMPRKFMQNNGHFLIRYNRTMTFTADPQRPACKGTDASGRKYEEKWGWVGGKNRKDQLYVRIITLHRPELVNDDIILMTDLIDSKLYPAVDLLECYRRRWGIEQMFQQVTEVFNLKHLIGTTPKAVIFQSAFCLLLYNIIQIIRSYVACDGGLSVEQVSGEKLFDDVHRELTGWAVMDETKDTIKLLAIPLSPEQMCEKLKELLHWKRLWLKSKTRSRPSVGGRTIRVKSGRSSVFKLLEAARAEKKQRQKRPRQKYARC